MAQIESNKQRAAVVDAAKQDLDLVRQGFSRDDYGLKALDTIERAGAVAENLDFLTEVAVGGFKGDGDLTLSSAALYTLVNCKDKPVQDRVDALLEDPKLVHNAKWLMMNQVASNLRTHDSARDVGLLQNALLSDNAFIQGHAVRRASELIQTNSPASAQLKETLREAVRKPASTPRSIDTVTREEYAALEVVEAFRKIGDVDALLDVARRTDTFPLVVAASAREELLSYFPDDPRVKAFLAE